jgi:hypothetical protein
MGRGRITGSPQPKHHESDVDRQPNQHCGNGKMDHCQTSLRSLDNTRGLLWFLHGEKPRGSKDVLPRW